MQILDKNVKHIHEQYIKRCYELAVSAGKKGFDTFGAVLVTNGKIIAETENTADYEKGIFGHAEFNLVHKCANKFSDAIFENSIFYTSCAPCVRCLMAIASLGIKTIVFGVSYKSFQKLLPFEEEIPDYEKILSKMNVSVEMIGPILEDEGMHTFEYWGGEYRPLEELIREMEGIKKMEKLKMNRTIKSMEDKYLQSSLDMIRRTFTNSESAENAQIVVNLVQEIRSMSFYVPELELIMVDQNDEVIGYSMFSRFHLEGKYSDELLLLSPVAVKTELQRQHISKELIENGLDKAKEMGFKVVIVEGNPMNYRNRGFKTSADFGIVAGESVGLPAIECLMVQELETGACRKINGILDYTIYKSLK